MNYDMNQDMKEDVKQDVKQNQDRAHPATGPIFHAENRGVPVRPEEIEEFLREMTFGFLSFLTTEGTDVTPIDFVYLDGEICFHGSPRGNRAKSLRERPDAVFAVAREFALIPSYFSDPRHACPASSYFKSVLVYGNVSEEEDPERKAKILTALMEKLQPEGGYAPFDIKDPFYGPHIAAVSISKLKAERISAKFKFGQNLNDDRRNRVITGLEERHHPGDLETIREMRRFTPQQRPQ